MRGVRGLEASLRFYVVLVGFSFWYGEVGGGIEDENKPDENDGTKKNLEARLPTAPLGVEIGEIFELSTINQKGGSSQ